MTCLKFTKYDNGLDYKDKATIIKGKKNERRFWKTLESFVLTNVLKYATWKIYCQFMVIKGVKDKLQPSIIYILLIFLNFGSYVVFKIF